MWVTLAGKWNTSLCICINLILINENYIAFTETGGHSDNKNQSDGRTQTIDSNIFKSSQSNVLFSNPANQTSDRKHVSVQYMSS